LLAVGSFGADFPTDMAFDHSPHASAQNGVIIGDQDAQHGYFPLSCIRE
jgi:hypothetical protein